MASTEDPQPVPELVPEKTPLPQISTQMVTSPQVPQPVLEFIPEAGPLSLEMQGCRQGKGQGQGQEYGQSQGQGFGQGQGQTQGQGQELAPLTLPLPPPFPVSPFPVSHHLQPHDIVAPGVGMLGVGVAGSSGEGGANAGIQNPLSQLGVGVGLTVNEEPDNMQELLYTHFMDKYRKWYVAKYDKPFQFPIFNRTYFDVERLWNEVMARGGSSQVCLSKAWAEIGRQFNPPKYMTNLSSIIRSLYERFLLPYELEVSPHTAMPMSNGNEKNRRRRRPNTPTGSLIGRGSGEFVSLEPPLKKIGLEERVLGVNPTLGEDELDEFAHNGATSSQQQRIGNEQINSPDGSGALGEDRVVLNVGGKEDNVGQEDAQLRDALRAATAHIHQLKAHHSQEMQLLQSFYQIRFEQMHARIQALEHQLGEAQFRYQDMLRQIDEGKRH